MKREVNIAAKQRRFGLGPMPQTFDPRLAQSLPGWNDRHVCTQQCDGTPTLKS